MGCTGFEHGPVDIICHLAQFIESLAFFQTNMVYLRAVQILSSLIMMSYAVYTTRDVFSCNFVWGIMQFIINSYRLALYARHHFASMSERERILQQPGSIFDIFTRAEFSVLKKEFIWKTFKAGDKMTEYGKMVKNLLLLTSGRIAIMNNYGRCIDTCDIGQLSSPKFVGELSFYTSKTATVTIKARSDVVAISWNMEKLRYLTNSHGHTLRSAVYRQLPSLFAQQIAADLNVVTGKKVAKVHKQWELLRAGAVGIRLSNQRRQQSIAYFHDNSRDKGGLAKEKSTHLDPIPDCVPVKKKRKKSLVKVAVDAFWKTANGAKKANAANVAMDAMDAMPSSMPVQPLSNQEFEHSPPSGFFPSSGYSPSAIAPADEKVRKYLAPASLPLPAGIVHGIAQQETNTYIAQDNTVRQFSPTSGGGCSNIIEEFDSFQSVDSYRPNSTRSLGSVTEGKECLRDEKMSELEPESRKKRHSLLSWA